VEGDLEAEERALRREQEMKKQVDLTVYRGCILWIRRWMAHSPDTFHIEKAVTIDYRSPSLR